MNDFLEKLSIRELVLLTVTLAVLVGGGYAFARYMPANKLIIQKAADSKKLQKEMLAADIPDELEGDMDDINNQIAELEKQVADARSYLPVFEQRLAPERSTELLLEISEAARKVRIRFKENQPFDAAKEIVTQTVSAAPRQRSRSSRRARIDPELRDRQAARQLAREAAVATAPVASQPVDEGRRQSVIQRMADGDLKRPMQRLVMTANFKQIQGFLAELDQLQWQVTVVQLQLAADAKDAPQGRPQLLNATMILAL